MEQTVAENFVLKWIKAWKDHDIDAIMAHYAEDVDFNSPFVREMGLNETGSIHGKTDLRLYFEKALQKNPLLLFDLQHIFAGSNSIVMQYDRMNKTLAGEYVELNADGKIFRSRSHYIVK
jgi:hypothetical protein